MARPQKPWYRKGKDAWFATIGGRQIRLAAGKDAKVEALAEFHRLMAGGAHHAPPISLDTAQICDLFLGHAQANLKASTFRFYRQHLQYFVKSCGTISISKLKPLHVSAHLANHPNWGMAMRNASITAIKRAVSWAVAEGHIPADPIKSVRKPEMPARKVISLDDAPGLESPEHHLSSNIRDMFDVLRLTGCRPGELVDITAADIDPDGMAVKVRGKMGERVVYLSPDASALLARLAAERPAGPLLLNHAGRPWNSPAIGKAVRRLRDRAGIKGATAYGMRHLYASRAVENGVNPLELAALMGHKSTRMLERHYVHHRAEALKRAARKAAGNPGTNNPSNEDT